jgi:hypothetical protein
MRRRLAHRFVLGFGRGPRQAGVHGGLGLAHRFHTKACADAWPLRAMRTTGFCHLLLQSRAPVPRSLSMRSRLARTESRRFRTRRPPWRSCLPSGDDRAPGGFTPPRWLWGTRRGFSAVPSTQCRACRIGCVCRPRGSLLWIGPTPQTTPRPLRGEAREGFTARRSDATSIERGISSTCVLRRLPRSAWHVGHAVRSCSAPLVLPPEGLALRPVAATIPRCFWQARLSRLGPRSRPRIGSIAVASLGQTQPLDFCNEFSNTTHEHMPASAALARRRGWPCERCRVRRALHAAFAILFCMQRWFRLVHRSELRDFPDTRARDPDPEGP